MQVFTCVHKYARSNSTQGQVLAYVSIRHDPIAGAHVWKYCLIQLLVAEMCWSLCCAIGQREKPARTVELNDEKCGAAGVNESDAGEFINTGSFMAFVQTVRKDSDNVAGEKLITSGTCAEDKVVRIVAKIRELAENLEGDFKKYPKKGRSFAAHAESRYCMVQPIPRHGPDDAAGENARSELSRWKNGRIAYWVDKAACKKGADEKGHVDLMRITKVVWERNMPHKVTLRHQDQGASYEMTLLFVKSKQAEDWARACWQLRSVLENF